MIGENYKCDGQLTIPCVSGKRPMMDIKPGECNCEFVLIRTKRAKYYKCVKCGKRCKLK